MSKETKQDVFEAAVDKAVGMTLLAGYTSYTDKCFKDMQKRYAAARDGDTDCPYCHEHEPFVDWDERPIGQYLDKYGDFMDNIHIRAGVLHSVTEGQYDQDIAINFCPMCGRKLRGDSNGD